MDSIHKKKIKRRLHYLAQNTSDLTQLMVFLVSKGILSSHEKQYIVSRSTEFDQTTAFYEHIIKKSVDAFDCLLEALNNTGNRHIAELLEKPLTGSESEIPLSDDDSCSTEKQIRFNVHQVVDPFIGREEKLKDLTAQFQASHKSKNYNLVCICGLGGVGKSELVRKYISTIYKDNLYNHILWINAETSSSLQEAFYRLAKDYLDILTSTKDKKEKEISSIVEEIYRNLCSKKCLIIFDNVSDKDIGIKDFLPPRWNAITEKVHVVLTTRYRDTGMTQMHTIDLEVFTPEEAESFVKENLKDQDNDIKGLCETLGFFPLALKQAVSYIKVTAEQNSDFGEDFTISDYLKKYHKTEENVKELLNYTHNSMFSKNENTTYITWKVTMDQIRTLPSGDETLKVMNLLAFFALSNIKFNILSVHPFEKKTVKTALSLLKKYSMITLQKGEINIHRLVQQVVRLDLKEAGTFDLKLKQILQFFSSIVANTDVVVSDYMQHAITAWNCVNTTTAEEHKKIVFEYGNLPSSLIKKLKNHTRYREALDFGNTVLLSFEKNDYPPIDNEIYQNLKVYVALIVRLQGHYDKALEMFKEIYELQKQSPGESDRRTLKTQQNIGFLYKMKRNNSEAFKIIDKVYKAQETLFPENLKDIFKTMQTLAHLLQLERRYDESIEMYEKLHNIFPKIDGNNEHLERDMLRVRNSIGGVYRDQMKYAEALEIFEDVLEKQKKLFSEKDPDTLRTWHNTGVVYKYMKKYHLAEKVFRNVSELQTEVLGIKNPDTLRTLHNLALVLTSLGKFSEAREKLQEILNQQKEMLGEFHLDTMRTEHSIGISYKRDDQINQAFKCFTKILEKQISKLGSDHQDTLQTESNLAWTKLQLGGSKEKYILEMKDIYTRQCNQLGSSHSDTARTKRRIEENTTI